MPDLDLEAIKRTWLNQCGPCDYGMPEYGCTHPQEDYRPVIMSLVVEIERLRDLVPDMPAVRRAADIEQAQRLAEVVDPPFREFWHQRATELLHICYGCQQEIAVADQLVVTMPDAIEYWHGKCHTGEGN